MLSTIPTILPVHTDSFDIEWLEQEKVITVRFKALASADDLSRMFDVLEALVQHWDSAVPFRMLVDTASSTSKPTWTPSIRQRALNVVKLAMGRGLSVQGAIILQDNFIRQIIQLFFAGAEPFTLQYKLKVRVFSDLASGQAWLMPDTTSLSIR